MKKEQLLQELGERGVVVHRSWTVPELRQILIEQRDLEKPQVNNEKMKGLTSLKLQELVELAEKNGLTIPTKPTNRGAIRTVQGVHVSGSTRRLSSLGHPGDEVQSQLPRRTGEVGNVGQGGPTPKGGDSGDVNGSQTPGSEIRTVQEERELSETDITEEEKDASEQIRDLEAQIASLKKKQNKEKGGQ